MTCVVYNSIVEIVHEESDATTTTHALFVQDVNVEDMYAIRLLWRTIA